MAITFVFHGERRGKLNLSVLWCLHITDHQVCSCTTLSILFNCKKKMITIIHYFDLTQMWKRNFIFLQSGQHSSMIGHRRSLLPNDTSLYLVPLAVFPVRLSTDEVVRWSESFDHLLSHKRKWSFSILQREQSLLLRPVQSASTKWDQPSFRTIAVSCLNSIFHSSPTVHVHFLPFALVQRHSHFWFLGGGCGAYTAFPTAKNLTSNHAVDAKSKAN